MTNMTYTPYLAHHRAMSRAATQRNTRELSALEIQAKKQRISNELRELGVSWIGRRTFESHYLPMVLHEDESMKGVVYGRDKAGSAMLVATDRRVLYINKKPFFVQSDELTYDVVSGVSYSKAGPSATITLHTRIGDYTLKVLNFRSAMNFVEFIETRCLDRNLEEAERFHR